ncbi:hypothetical protein SDC9_170705 [bioreactor metagenome]|uniref:Uncharacterized protein n=1 Tax=bioreactor metagenome TaxID=1076179 RepID=A0A645G8U4_9ZZZZ
MHAIQQAKACLFWLNRNIAGRDQNLARRAFRHGQRRWRCGARFAGCALHKRDLDRHILRHVIGFLVAIARHIAGKRRLHPIAVPERKCPGDVAVAPRHTGKEHGAILKQHDPRANQRSG